MLDIFSIKPFGEPYDVQSIALNLVLSFLLCLIIAMVYKKTHRGLSYSQGFVMNLVLMGIIISSVMMVIGNNIARAFGAFGAFSLIRFRTAIKDPRDITFVFLTLALGMAVGTRNYLIALEMTVFATIVIFALTKINFGSIKRYDYVLTFVLAVKDSSRTDVYREVFNEFLRVSDLLNINTLKGGKLLELSFNIRFFDEEKKGEFIKKMSTTEGVSEVNLIAAKNDIEY